jgi:hypothetical protein
MRAVAAELERIAESARGFFPPVVEGFSPRQAVKGVVDLDGVEMTGVERQPLCLRKILRVKDPSPVIVLVTRRADVTFRHRDAARNEICAVKPVSSRMRKLNPIRT